MKQRPLKALRELNEGIAADKAALAGAYGDTTATSVECLIRIQALFNQLINGYSKLYELGRLDLTVEAMVVENTRWHPGFRNEEMIGATRACTHKSRTPILAVSALPWEADIRTGFQPLRPPFRGRRSEHKNKFAVQNQVHLAQPELGLMDSRTWNRAAVRR